MPDAARSSSLSVPCRSSTAHQCASSESVARRHGVTPNWTDYATPGIRATERGIGHALALGRSWRAPGRGLPKPVPADLDDNASQTGHQWATTSRSAGRPECRARSNPWGSIDGVRWRTSYRAFITVGLGSRREKPSGSRPFRSERFLVFKNPLVWMIVLEAVGIGYFVRAIVAGAHGQGNQAVLLAMPAALCAGYSVQAYRRWRRRLNREHKSDQLGH